MPGLTASSLVVEESTAVPALEWAAPIDRPRDLVEAASLHEARRGGEEGLSDRTWRDLSMNDVFARSIAA